MKKFFLYIMIIFIIIVLISFIIIDVRKKTVKSEFSLKLERLNNVDRELYYFNYKLLDRYLLFKENNPNLDNIDIITRVNLNLDKDDYTETKVSPYLNKTTILVNKHIYLPKNYIPNNLVKLNTDYANSDRYLVDIAKESLEKMINDIKKENLTIRVISAYRSYDYQKDLYNNYVKKDGTLKADTYSARPGYSEHQTGLVIDIDNGTTYYEDFDKTEEYKWMLENSYKYGFILRYPKGKEEITRYNYESWHYRYVGVKIATYLKEHNLTFDEYYARFIEK